MTAPLSEEWVAGLAERLAAFPVGEPDGPRLRVGLRVVADDGSARLFTAVLGAGQPGEFIPGEDGAPEVVLVESEETARRVTAGAPIAEELAAGRVKLEGDVSRLLGTERELSALAAAFSEG